MSLWFLIAFSVFAGIFLQRVSGNGLAMVMVPIIGLALGPLETVLLVNMISIPALVFLLLSQIKDVDWRQTAWISGFSLLALYPSTKFIQAIPEAWLQLLIGLIMVAALMISRFVNPVQKEGANPLPPMILCGLVSGFLTVAAGIPAPAMVIYARYTKWQHASYAASQQAMSLVRNGGALASKLAAGMAFPTYVLEGPRGVLLLLLCAFAVWVGGLASKKISGETGLAIALWVSVIGSILAIGRGLSMLLGA